MTEDNGTRTPGDGPDKPDQPVEAGAPEEKKEPAQPGTAGGDEDDAKAKATAAAKAKAAAAAKAKAAEEAEPKPPWEEKPVAPEHQDATDDPDVAALNEALDGVVTSSDRFAGDPTAVVPADRIVEACRYLKELRGFAFLVDLTAVDWPEREEGRFDIVYWMHRFDDSKRLRLRIVAAEDATVPTVSGVWKTANWMEREVYDMFGVIFEGHPSLERILTWEGFNGHPLRKDFPVEGIDTGAAIYPDVYPPGGGPILEGEGGEEAAE
ncbi:MAG: NADH-quinone oxidoreductase subunit C [Acidobacteria bacterium]|nr:NADH-quinone oxidoreductase subunit C [Acidobacteriota bacterium]